ncbi:neuropeptide FF receptor 2-like [Branchiostoma lanceolatum]|uniref:neuropeptide FF receptor 2-like n=1 Tax=Branchiostoma lanceolatum TaxID=7740 RepID=UPI003456D935
MDIFNDSTNATNGTIPFFVEKYKHGAGVMSLIILAYVLVFVLCVAGNIIVCTVVIRTPRLRTVTNYFILNLAVSDLLVAVFCMPFTLVEHILTDYQFGDVMCRVNPMIQGVSVAASVYTMTAIAFDRYKAIVFPMEDRMSLKRMWQIVGGIWVCGIVIMLPQVFVLQVVSYGPSADNTVSACIEIWPLDTYRQVYTAALVSLVYVLPLLVISYLYCRVMYKLSSTPSSAGQRPTQFAVSRKRVKVLKMLITVVVLFALSWLPLYTCWMMNEFADLALWQRAIISHYIYPIGHWLAYSNSCANPIVYGFFNSNIRKNLDRSSSSRRRVEADTRARKPSPTPTTKHTHVRRDLIEMQPLNLQ